MQPSAEKKKKKEDQDGLFLLPCVQIILPVVLCYMQCPLASLIKLPLKGMLVKAEAISKTVNF